MKTVKKRILRKRVHKLDEVLHGGLLEAQKKLKKTKRLSVGRCLLLIMNDILTVQELIKKSPEELRALEPTIIDDEFIENIQTMLSQKIFNGSVPEHWKPQT